MYISARYVCHTGSILASMSISETIIIIVPEVVSINGLTVTFQIAVVSQGISLPDAKNCTGFPHHQTVGVLEAELLKSDVYLQ